MTTLNHQELLDYLPHRHPFVLVDKVISIEANVSVVGIKNVTATESFFPGHFPGQPVMPGVLMVEAMAQLATILASYSTPENKGKIFFFAGIDKVRFKRPVTPGDTLTMTITILKAKSRLYKVAGKAEVDGEVACEAEITAMLAKS